MYTCIFYDVRLPFSNHTLAFSPFYANLRTPQASSVQLADGPKPDAKTWQIFSKPDSAQHGKDILPMETSSTCA